MINYESKECPANLAAEFARRAALEWESSPSTHMIAEVLDLLLFGAKRDRTQLEVLARIRSIVEDAIADQAGREGNRSPKTWKQIGAELGMPPSTAHSRYSSRFSRKK